MRIWRGQAVVSSISPSDQITITNTQPNSDLQIHSIQLDDFYLYPKKVSASVFDVNTMSVKNDAVGTYQVNVVGSSSPEAKDQMLKTKGLLVSDLGHFAPLTDKKIVQKGPKSFCFGLKKSFPYSKGKLTSKITLRKFPVPYGIDICKFNSI